MDRNERFPSDVAFTETVKAIQSRKGSRHAYSRMEQGDGWQTTITDELKSEIESQVSVFLATANAQGQPYIQHRGGPRGFLQVLDETTVAFADFAGNRQYITQGNLSENPKAQLFLIDYAHRSRFKIWGTARVVEDDAALLAKLMPPGYRARPESVVLFSVGAWDANCPQHIPQRLDAVDVKAAIDKRDRRIAELEAEVWRVQRAHDSGTSVNASCRGSKLSQLRSHSGIEIDG
jgi:predicted pyridoxine 5'-phosphate oxidase superfamily flavin-nucleotide-binding protein